MIVASSLTQLVRSNAKPLAWACCFASMSRSNRTSKWSATNPQAHTTTPEAFSLAARSSMTAKMSGPIQGSGVRPADCQAIDHDDQESKPAAMATASAVERSSSGYGSPASMIRCGSEWAVKSTLAFAGIVDSRLRKSAAKNSTNAGSVAHESIAVTVMPCGSAAARARPMYWPMENDEK